VAFGVTFALLGVAENFVIYLIIMGIAGFFMPVIATAETVFIQENTEASKMGRVFSIVQIISASAMPLAILFFGPLADLISVESILIVSGILLAMTGILYQQSNTKYFKKTTVINK
jgi:DHA3 family macrolide efflux protein-like MFS transporter